MLADAIIIRRQSKYADSDRYQVLPVDADPNANGINLDPSTAGEFDHVVVDSRTDKVVAVYETKIKSSLDGDERIPSRQAGDTLDRLLTEDQTTIDPDFLTEGQFRDTEIEAIGIGPNDAGYEIDDPLPYSNEELRGLFDALSESSVTKANIRDVAKRTAGD